MAPSTTPPPGPERPRPGDVLRLTIERGAAEGYAVASHRGFVVLVSRALPGETVDARVARVEARHAIAHAIAIHTPSLHRVSAPCPHYERCGGCDLQHIAYPEQLVLKRAALADQLQRIGGIADVPVAEVRPASRPLRYRDRLDFVLERDVARGTVMPAFHGLLGGATEPIGDCLLAAPELTRLAIAAASALSGMPASLLPSRVRVQECEDEFGGAALSLTLFAESESQSRKLKRQAATWLPQLLNAQPRLMHVAVARTPGGDTDAAGLDIEPIHGEVTMRKRIGRRFYRLPVDGFFQVHPSQAEAMVSRVVDAVRTLLPAEGGASPIVFDLYCGVGLFSIPLAECGFRVLGIEISPSSVRAARQTVKENPSAAGPRPEFKVRDLDEAGVLEEAVQSAGRPDLVVVDPPRRGIGARLSKSLITVRPSWIVYVSCDGGSFARDAARLGERYELAEVQPFDLFPQTHHIELVAVFRNRR